MANPCIDVTQTKTLSVVFKADDGTVIPAGGPVTWSIAPTTALGKGIPADNQSVPLTGQAVGTNVTIIATEPVSGKQFPYTLDVAAVQMLITGAVFTLS